MKLSRAKEIYSDLRGVDWSCMMSDSYEVSDAGHKEKMRILDSLTGDEMGFAIRVEAKLTKDYPEFMRFIGPRKNCA